EQWKHSWKRKQRGQGQGEYEEGGRRKKGSGGKRRKRSSDEGEDKEEEAASSQGLLAAAGLEDSDVEEDAGVNVGRNRRLWSDSEEEEVQVSDGEE
ncbi:hypothetical protein M569_17128, partial [Genlisea aurea]